MALNFEKLRQRQSASNVEPIVNTTGYAYHGDNMGNLAGTPNDRPRLKLEVTFILDMVNGAFDRPEDLMHWITKNPYVDTVTLVEEDDDQYIPDELEQAEAYAQAYELSDEPLEN